MESPEASHQEHADSINLLAIVAIAALTAWIVTSVIPEWPIVYYQEDKGIIEGCMYVMVPNDGNAITKVPCENFTPSQLKRMGGYAQK